MNFWIVNSVLSFLLSAVCAGVIIPQILLVSFRRRLFDLPDERKIHHCAVPRLGGFAFLPVICFSFAIQLGVSVMIGHWETSSECYANAKPLAFAFCSGMVLYMAGLADDLVGIRYRAKFVIQILSGAMLIVGGITISDLHGVLGIHAIPCWLSYPLTLLLVVFIINAINLIDGIDGLASGLSGVACLFYGVSFIVLHQYIYAVVAFATLGVLVSFLYYNVFGKAERGRKIFMGDTGSLTIGLMLCIFCLKLTMCASDEEIGNINPMVLAFTPLLVPCCDVVRVYLHRIRHGKNPFLPDKNHIHHKLLAIGLKQSSALVVILIVSTFFVISNILLSRCMNVNLIVLGDVLIWTLANVWLSKRIRRIQKPKDTYNVTINP